MILTIQALRAAISRKRTEHLQMSFDEAVEAVAADLHLTVESVLRAITVKAEEVTQ